MTLSLAAAVQYSGMPTMKLVGTSTTGTPSPVPVNTLIDVWRTHANGTRHRVLTDQGPRLIGGGWAWLDIHCPYNQQVTYEITANGFTATSNPAVLPSNQTWLLHPSRADLSVQVDMVTKIDSRSTGSRSQKFKPIGGKPVFLSDGARDSISGSFTVFTTDTGPLGDLFEDDSLILVNTPGIPGWDLSWLWVQPGTIAYANPADGVRVPARLVTIPFEESADPDADLEPAWTSGDAEAYWTAQGVDSGQVTARYLNCLNFLTDTRL